MTKLKPCPYCGYEDVSIANRKIVYDGTTVKPLIVYFARCIQCFAQGPRAGSVEMARSKYGFASTESSNEG